MTLLTKSLFVCGMSCPELMWYLVHEPGFLGKLDCSAQRRMRLGSEVGFLARQRFPEGILIEGNNETSTELTKQLLQKQDIYEATFMHENLLCKVDILTKNLDIIEVKSSTRIKDEHLTDIAFQTYVLKKCGISVNRSLLMHINSEYNRVGDVNLKQLFTIVDVTKMIKVKLDTIEKDIQYLQKFLKKPKPIIKPGKHCSDTTCPLAIVANSQLPKYNVTQLYRSNGQKFLDKGITIIVNIKDGLNKKQTIQYNAVKSNTPYIDKKQLLAWIQTLHFPITHLDFETIDFPIPRWEHTRPYLQIPFQYSAHIQYEDGRVEHIEYLHTDSQDPRSHVLKHMKTHIPEYGTILAHYATFEKKRLQELATEFIQDSEWINKVLVRVEDLIVPFQNFWYYHPEQMGSCSIKYILPALIGKTYDGMEVANGTEAQIGYEKLLNDSSNEKLIKDMLVYCEQDTQAMVDILKVLMFAVE